MIGLDSSTGSLVLKQFLVLWVAALAAYLIAVPCFAKGTNPAEGLVLTQASVPMGDRQVLIRNDAIKVINYAQNLVILAKAPKWQVYTYNVKRKLYTDMKFEKFVKKLKSLKKSMHSLQLEDPEQKWVKQRDETIDGVKSTMYLDKSTEMSLDGVKTKGWRKYWIAYQNIFPRPIVRVLAAEYGVPNLGGVPIHFESFGQADTLAFMGITAKMDIDPRAVQKRKKEQGKLQKKTSLRTSKIEIKPLPDSIFDLPKGLTKTAKGHSHEVMMDEKADKAFKDMLAEPDFLFRGGK